MTFTQISTSIFPLNLFGAQVLPGQNPWAGHFGLERGKAIYIIGKFPCMEKLFLIFLTASQDLGWESWTCGLNCLISPLRPEALPDGKLYVREAAPAA